MLSAPLVPLPCVIRVTPEVNMKGENVTIIRGRCSTPRRCVGSTPKLFLVWALGTPWDRSLRRISLVRKPVRAFMPRAWKPVRALFSFIVEYQRGVCANQPHGQLHLAC